MQLRDRFGRIHDDLRVSVTDRCNLRCSYCLPREPEWFPHDEILRFEEIARLVAIAARLGVRRVRLTGGEPLVRRGLPELVSQLRAIPGIDELSLTTNGLLLGALAGPLARGGLQRINVSLDTLDPARYERITRRDVLHQVLAGIATAEASGLGPIKVNTVLLRGLNEDELESLVAHAREHGWELRFIEYMPLENDASWQIDRVVTGAELRERIHRRWPIEPDDAGDPRAPAVRYRYRDGRGTVGFIDSISRPFCATCSRLRLTSDGKLRVCLYDDCETDLRAALRGGADEATLIGLFQRAVQNKGRGGALEILERQAALPLARTMHQIGG